MQMRSFGSVMGSLVLGCLLVGPLTACGPKAGVVKSGGPTLYDRLGGREAIAAVVADFVDGVKADDRIKAKFANTTDWDGLRTKLTDQICAAAGGPCTYTGKDMKSSHKGMAITEPEFNALVDDLKKTLDKFKVGEKEQADLIGTLAPMKKDIVTAPSP